MPAALPASISFAPLVAAPVALVAATTAAPVLVEPMSEFERGRLAGLAASVHPVSPQPSLVARVTSLPLASPPVVVRAARALFVPPLGSAQGAIRPRVHGPLFSEVRTHANLLDPEYEPIQVSGIPAAPNPSAGALSGPRGVWSNAIPLAPGVGRRSGPASEGWTALPTTRPNPPCIMGGLTSTSPGGSTAPSLTNVPAENDLPFLDHEALANMDWQTSLKNPTKYKYHSLSARCPEGFCWMMRSSTDADPSIRT
jgi:hypothetical protein